MIYWIILLLALVLLSGMAVFGAVVHIAFGLAKILFTVFLALLLASLVLRIVRGR